MITSEIFEFTRTQFVLIGSILTLLVVWLCLRSAASVTLIANEKGDLRISRHALHRLIENCCEQVRGVSTARASVGRSGGKFTVTMRLRVRPNAKLDAIQGYLTQEVGDVFRENLGIAEIGRVKIKIVGVTRDQAL